MNSSLSFNVPRPSPVVVDSPIQQSDQPRPTDSASTLCGIAAAARSVAAAVPGAQPVPQQSPGALTELFLTPPTGRLHGALHALRPAPMKNEPTPAAHFPSVAGMELAPRKTAMKLAPAARTADVIRPKSERDLMREPTSAGVEYKKNVEAGRPAITAGLVERARQAGFGQVEADQLKSILLNSKDFTTDAKLVADLLATENPVRALKTFIHLDVDRRQHPGRITPDIVRALSMGVGEARTSATQGREGILTNASAVNAANALIHMPQADYDKIRGALASAGTPATAGSDPQTERALILKAVGARHERLTDYTAWNATGQASPAANEITQFADAIRGKNAATLIERTTALDLDGDGVNEALRQKWNDSCVQATLQIARAEADPIYAWQLHQSDVLNNTLTTGIIADEQKQQLIAAGGDPKARGTSGTGTQIEPWTSTLNNSVSPTTNRNYEERVIADNQQSRTNAVEMLEVFVKSGTDVPIRVAWNGGGAHALLVTDVRGTGDNRQFLVTDPWNGRTDWVSRQDIINGNTNFFAGTGRISHYWY